MKIITIEKNGISGTYIELTSVMPRHASANEPHRNLNDITKIINRSRLSANIKRTSIAIFTRLAKAEAKVHGTTIDKIHFHEVGALDAIIDIVGTCIALEMLGIEQIYSSPLPLSKGFVKTAHGKLPVPAPATIELLKGVPVYDTDVKGELVTPTGAAIITTISSSFGLLPAMEIGTVGYGAGKYDFGHPNVLRVLIGEKLEQAGKETVYLIETNIDDMNPQFYDHAMGLLFKAGALDVWLENIQMKKNRPGVKLSVILEKKDLDRLSRTVLSETTSLGIRIREVSRIKAKKTFKTVRTKFGKIRIKFGDLDGRIINAMPEYEDVKKAAIKYKVPLKEVYKHVNG